MKKLLVAGLAAFFCLAACLPAQTNVPSGIEQQLSSYKTEMDSCVSSFSRTNTSKEELSEYLAETGLVLEKYETFRDSLGSNELSIVESDQGLSRKLVELYIKKAEQHLAESEFDTKRPSISSIESALGFYQKAYAVLKRLSGEDFAKPARRVESGFARTIIGLNNFDSFNKADSLMNPEGKPWEFNPVKKIQEFDNDLKNKIAYAEQWDPYRRMMEKSINALESATKSKNEQEILGKMIDGSQWLTTLLMTNKNLFVEYFPKYGLVLTPAKEIVEKKYSQKELGAFDKWYKNLPGHYNKLVNSINSTGRK